MPSKLILLSYGTNGNSSTSWPELLHLLHQQVSKRDLLLQGRGVLDPAFTKTYRHRMHIKEKNQRIEKTEKVKIFMKEKFMRVFLQSFKEEFVVRGTNLAARTYWDTSRISISWASIRSTKGKASMPDRPGWMPQSSCDKIKIKINAINKDKSKCMTSWSCKI